MILKELEDIGNESNIFKIKFNVYTYYFLLLL